MKKDKTEKLKSADCVKQLRRSIKEMRAGQVQELHTVFDAFEMKFFSKGTTNKMEEKRSLLRSFFRK